MYRAKQIWRGHKLQGIQQRHDAATAHREIRGRGCDQGTVSMVYLDISFCGGGKQNAIKYVASPAMDTWATGTFCHFCAIATFSSGRLKKAFRTALRRIIRNYVVEAAFHSPYSAQNAVVTLSRFSRRVSSSAHFPPNPFECPQ